MRLCRAVALAVVVLAALPAYAQPQPAWEQWRHQPGVVDLGARADGTLVAMAAGRLFLVSQDGSSVAPFADGPNGFSGDPNAEPYFVVTQPLSVDGAGCTWNADDLFILELGSPNGIVRVDLKGNASHFATLAGVDTLGGIALDTTGQFGHRLLVTGTHNGNQTTVFSVDCQGASSTITDSAPPVEGGLAVAPASFGQFAGDLIAPDENTGQVWAVDPSGRAVLVTAPNLPIGGDTGVESEGFIPAGFLSSAVGANAYLADRATPNNPFPGTDSILRLAPSVLSGAGAQEGDLLVATEGNGTTVLIHCAEACTATPLAQGTNGGHIEGHIAFTEP